MLNPYSLDTYWYLGVIPCCVGSILRKCGVDEATYNWTFVVVYVFAALGNYQLWWLIQRLYY